MGHSEDFIAKDDVARESSRPDRFIAQLLDRNAWLPVGNIRDALSKKDDVLFGSPNIPRYPVVYTTCVLRDVSITEHDAEPMHDYLNQHGVPAARVLFTPGEGNDMPTMTLIIPARQTTTFLKRLRRSYLASAEHSNLQNESWVDSTQHPAALPSGSSKPVPTKSRVGLGRKIADTLAVSPSAASADAQGRLPFTVPLGAAQQDEAFITAVNAVMRAVPVDPEHYAVAVEGMKGRIWVDMAVYDDKRLKFIGMVKEPILVKRFFSDAGRGR